MDNVIIRFAKDSDLKDIDSLLYQVHKVHSDARPDLFKAGVKKYTDEEVLKIIHSDTYKVFVAEIEGKVLGYAFCISQEPHGNTAMPIKTLYIDDLCVDKDERGHHVGSKLYESVCAYAKENGYYNVTLNVWAFNEKARKFYEHVGLSVLKIGMEKIL